MSVFNSNSRTANVVYSSSVSTICNVVNTLLGFIYRTIFLSVLSASYLGINGLFTNILQVLSLADLGISVAITYRFYDPISREDVQKVGELMQFFKKIYLLIAAVIGILGMAIFPFLDFFIKDASEVPSDVNLKLVYVLFLVQTLSSYLFSYKLTILYADQKQYIMSLINSVTTVIIYIGMVAVLYIYRDFTMTIIIHIFITILSNIVMSIWVTKQYPSVFAVKDMLPKDERNEIFKDTGATMCHKIGGTVLTGTDNLILTKFIGLIVTGIYSNYSLIFTSLSTVLTQLLGTFTSSFGNAYAELSPDENYRIYRKLQFVNFWLSGMCATCLFMLINDFIRLWVGKSMLFGMFVVVTLSAQFWIESIRQITASYSNACGLFVKDKIRPLIEASINLVVSIYLAIELGVAGIFIGTIISHLLTVSWREPLILFRNAFNRSVADYWKMFATFLAFTVIISAGLWYACANFLPPVTSFLLWFAKAIFCALVFNLAAALVFRRTEEYKYFKEIVSKVFNKLLSKFRKNNTENNIEISAYTADNNEDNRKNDNPLISVIVPVYKAEKYLRTCIDSILNQTYSNLEVILVDDESPDACPAICDEYAQKDERVKVIHKSNGGQSSARNAGLEIATGELLGYVDSDDYIKLDMFEKLYNNMKETGADMSTCGLEIVSDNAESSFLPDDTSAFVLLSRDDALGILLDNNLLNFSPVNKLYKRSLVGDLRFVEGMIYEDGEYVERCVNAVENVVCSGEPLYYYNTFSESTTRGRISRKQLVDIIRANNIRLDFYRDNAPQHYDKAINVYVKDLMLVLASSVHCTEFNAERLALRKKLLEILSNNETPPFARENHKDVLALKAGLAVYDLKKKLRS